MTKDEALRMALEALQWSYGGEPMPSKELEAINAILQVRADQKGSDMRETKSLDEQFRKLAVKAGFNIIEDNIDVFRVAMDNRHTLQRFAELIVRECAEMASDYDGSPLSLEETILNHFGVSYD